MNDAIMPASYESLRLLLMQLIVRDEGGVVVPVFADFLMASTTKLAHGPVASNIEMDGLRVPERWWFS